MKILVVEDEIKTGEYLAKGLTEAGFVVDHTDNGLNGYHLAMTADYDLIVLDIMLPDVNGWDIVRMLRAANKGMPILLLTALGTIEHRVKGLELGADETALHTSIGTYADELGIDAIIAVGSAQDQHLDALAQALADGARQSQSASVDCVHDIDAAEQLVIDLARNHPDAVVLLKGSHASGLSALAERWAKN